MVIRITFTQNDEKSRLILKPFYWSFPVIWLWLPISLIGLFIATKLIDSSGVLQGKVNPDYIEYVKAILSLGFVFLVSIPYNLILRYLILKYPEKE